MVQVADDDVQRPVLAEGEDSAVVVRAAQHRQVENQIRADEGRPVPGVAVDAVGEGSGGAGRVGSGRALRVIKEDASVHRKVRIESDAEQPAFAGGIDGHVQDRGGLEDAADDSAHLPVGLLQDEDVPVADEGHGRRLRQSGRDHLHLKPGVVDRLGRGGDGEEEGERDPNLRA